MDPMIPKEFRQKFAKTEQLTRSPQVNELIKICKDIEEGKGDVDVLKAQIDILYDVHEAMTTAYEALAPTQPKTPVFIEKGKIMLKGFEDLKEGLDEISLYLEDEELEHIHIGLDTVKKAMDVIMGASDSIKKEEEEEIMGTYSNSPQINELIRIGKGVLKGEFEPIYFFRRYEVAEDIYAKTYSNMQKLSKMDPDTKAMEEQLPIIMKALETFRDGLDDLKEYFGYMEKKMNSKEEAEEEAEEAEEEGDEEFDVEGIVSSGLDKIQEASKCMYNATLAVKDGIDNAMVEDAKKKEWQSKIPGFASGSVGGGFDIKVGEPTPVPSQEQLMVPPNYKKVYDAAWAVLKSEISKDEFISTLDWLAGTINKNLADVPKLIKPKGLNEKEEQLFDETKKCLTDAMENTIKGLDEMRLFVNDGQTLHLESGLDVIMRAGDALYKVQLAGEEAGKKIQQAKEAAKKKK